MNAAIASRRTLIAALFVPAMALTGMTAEAVTGNSEAFAQVSPPNQQRPPVPESSNGATTPELPPCPPGAAPTPNCRPWNPPRRAESEEDCECQITYQTMNGQRVAVRDCYVLLPNDKVYYCEQGRLVER